MYYAGIDIGSLTAEAVIVKDGKLVAAEIMNVLPNPVDSAREVMSRAFKSAGIAAGDIGFAIATGYGRDQVQAAGMAQQNVSEISCHGYGAYCVDSAVRTVIDIGGQDAKVIKVDGAGKLINFVMNDKCAAGTGHFLEVMSRTLQVGLEDLGLLALESKKPVLMSNRCTIYVETEVIHYLQRGVSRRDVAAGISRAMAERVVALSRRIQPEHKIMLTGGVAKNTAVRTELEKILNAKMERPSLDPQIIGAFGAAMLAARGAAP